MQQEMTSDEDAPMAEEAGANPEEQPPVVPAHALHTIQKAAVAYLQPI